MLFKKKRFQKFYEAIFLGNIFLTTAVLIILSFPSLPLLLGPLKLGVAVLVRVPSMVQIELFHDLLYLKPFNCVCKQMINIKLNY